MSKYLTEARLSKGVALQVQKINESSGKYNIGKVNKILKRKENTDTTERLQPCRYCGMSGLHPIGRQCPAYGKRCFKCHKIDHFAAVCRTKQYELGSFNKDYIDEEYRSKYSRDRHSRINNINKLEENDNSLSVLNLAYVENADTAKTMMEGWKTSASTEVVQGLNLKYGQEENIC